jgi:hypothetical protein
MQVLIMAIIDTVLIMTAALIVIHAVVELLYPVKGA